MAQTTQEVPVEWVASMSAGPAWDVVTEGDHAFLAMTTGLQVVDLSEPTNPKEIAFLGLPGMARELVIEDGLVYLACEDGGLWIIDVSAPREPAILGSYTGHRIVGLDVKEGVVYGAAEKAGLLVIDASNPSGPFLKSVLENRLAYEISVQNELLFVENGSGGFLIFDIQQPTLPRFLGDFDTGWDAESVTIQGEVAYVAAGSSGLMVYDLQDPSNPILVETVDTPGYAFDIMIRDEALFLADWWKGLRVFDVSDPYTPENVTELSAWGTVRGIALYDHYLIMANNGDGLKVVDITHPPELEVKGDLGLLGTAYDLELVEDLLFVANGHRGVEVYDLFSPQEPNLIYSLDTEGFAIDIKVKDSVAYVADGEGGVLAVDISDVGHLKVLDIYETPGYANDLALAEDKLFVADFDEGLTILDVADPDDLQLVVQYNTSGAVFDVMVDNEVAYLASDGEGVVALDITELSSPEVLGIESQVNHPRTLSKKGDLLMATGYYSGLYSMDISNPSDIKILDNLKLSWGETAQAQTWLGDMLAVARGTMGVVFLDLEDPNDIKKIASYDSAETAYDIVYHQQHFYVANGKAGLQIIEINLPAVTIDYILPATPMEDEEVTLLGSVYDPTSGEWTYEWYSSLDGLLGEGAILEQVELSSGNHILTLQVTNDQGMKGTDIWTTVEVEAVPGYQKGGGEGDGDGVELDPRLVALITVTVLASSLGSVGYGIHAAGETGRYQFFALMAPLMARRKERRKNDPLAHETRGYIRGYLLANPGAHYRMLKAALKLTNGTLAHHLMIMEREGLVVSRRRGQLRCFYLVAEGVGTAIPQEGDQLSPTQENIMNLIEAHPGISQKDLAVAMDMTAAAIKYNIDQLLEGELVRKERRGMWVSYYLAPPKSNESGERIVEEGDPYRFRP